MLLLPLGPVFAVDQQTATLLPVKLHLSSLPKADQATFWKRLDTYAFFEAALAYCGHASNVAARVAQAVRPCVANESINAALSYFGRRVRERAAEVAGADCSDPTKVAILRKARAVFDDLVKNAAAQCRACLTC